MAVIYTDQSGQGYDYGQLDAAYKAGKFESGSRVPDILQMYGGQPAAPAPANNPNIRSDFPGAANLTIQAPPTSTTPGGSGSEATMNQLAPSSASDPLSAHDAAITQAFQQYLGRAASPSDLASFRSNPYGSYQTVPGWTQMRVQEIAQSPEAQAYAAAGPARQKITPVPAVTQTTGNPTPTPTGSGNPSTIYGNDPNASLLINTILSRLQQLQKPVDTTAQDAYAKQALDRVQQLSGAPFTDPQSQALITKMRDPLTQARDQAKQQAAEQLSRRGIGPTSGVFVDTMSKIDQAYERGIASGTNSLAVKGIDQQTQNAMQQLQILNSIVEMNRATQNQQEGLSSQLVPTAASLTNFDSSRLDQLLRASGSAGGDPTSLISALTGLGGLGIQQQGLNNSANSANAYALAQMVYALMNGTAGLIH